MMGNKPFCGARGAVLATAQGGTSLSSGQWYMVSCIVGGSLNILVNVSQSDGSGRRLCPLYSAEFSLEYRLLSRRQLGGAAEIGQGGR